MRGRLTADSALNGVDFADPTQGFQRHYSDARPHSQLGWRTPSEFAFTCHPRRELALRYAAGSAPAPAATTAQPGKSNSRGKLRTG